MHKMELGLFLLLLLVGTSYATQGNSNYANQVFHVSDNTSYGMTYSQAYGECKRRGTSLATLQDLESARQSGYSLCKCGWTMAVSAWFPMAISVTDCGGRAALHQCEWGNGKWDAYCYKGDATGKCASPLGMENKEISDYQLWSSSEYKSWWPVFRSSRWSAQTARLNNYNLINAWIPKQNSRKEYLEIDLDNPVAVTGIVTQGAKRLGTKYWVSAFTIKYSKDGYNYRTYRENGVIKVFQANRDNNGHVRNMFTNPILTRHVRIHPHDWNEHGIAMRVELLGCDLELYQDLERAVTE